MPSRGPLAPLELDDSSPEEDELATAMQRPSTSAINPHPPSRLMWGAMGQHGRPRTGATIPSGDWVHPSGFFGRTRGRATVAPLEPDDSSPEEDELTSSHSYTSHTAGYGSA